MVSRLVIAKRSGLIYAIEAAGAHEDFPPTPREIVSRWIAQGVIAHAGQVEVWEEQAGFYYTRLAEIPAS